MAASATVTLHIGSAIPLGNEAETAKVITLWQYLNGYFKNRSFKAQSGINGKTSSYQITLDASDLLACLQGAQQTSGAFTEHRKAHMDDKSHRVHADLAVTISHADHDLDEEESYQVATVFIQQLVIASHLALPGALHMLNTRFTGPGSHRYEAQNYDCRILYGALKTAESNSWPKLQNHPFETIWAWLNDCEVSQSDTAITDINKVLFTLLKIAQQRQEYSARTVLLIVYPLEVLMGTQSPSSMALTRSRARLVMGNIPEAADCFIELFEVRNSLFVATQPVHRPPLICHNSAEALKEQIGQYNTAVESGTALLLALLQDLIAHGAQKYEFNESFARQ